MDQKTTRLGEEKISKLLWEFSIPAIVGMIVISLYAVIDRIFVGRFVGSAAIAGMSITMPISFVMMACGMLIGVGSGALISIRLGEKKMDEAERILGNAVSLVLIFSTILSGLMLYFLDDLLLLFGASQQILPYGKQFIAIILYGSIFQYLSFTLTAIIRAEGSPRTAMVIMICNAGLNIILDYIFVYLLGYGVPGTAIATIISQCLATVLALFYFRGNNNMLRLRVKYMRLNYRLVLGIFSIGMAPFLMQLSGSLINILLNKGLSTYGGDTAIAAFGVISTVGMFLLMPVFGINQGVQPIIGYNYGAKDYKRVKKALRLAVYAAVTICTAGFLLVQIFPKQLMSIFSNDAKLLETSTHGLHFFMLLLPVVGYQIVCSNFFQAIGKAGKSMLMSLMRQVIALIPLVLILPRYYGLDGIWYAAPLSDLIAFIVTTIFIIFEWKKLSESTHNSTPSSIIQENA